jgi:hypothetical protein
VAISRRLDPARGRIAIATNAERDVVDAAASARKVIAGRIFSVSGSQRARLTSPGGWRSPERLLEGAGKKASEP